MKIYTLLLVGVLASRADCYGQAAKPAAKAGAAAQPASSLASMTKGLQKFDGYFPFYYDPKTGKVLLEVSRLNEEFLYFGSLSSGVGNGIERGQSSSAIAKFVRVGGKVLLIEPNLDYRASSGNTDEQRAVDNAFAKSVIWGFVPVATEGSKVLLDLTPFLVRDSQKIGERLSSSGFQGPGAGLMSPGGAKPSVSYRFDESRSAVYLENTRNFPKNTEFEAMITFAGGASGGGYDESLAPDPSAVTVQMHQAFIELPDNKFRARKFDPRSGFNQFSFVDFSAPINQPLAQRFTVRHRLEKKDPTAATSEAVKPIVYYVDRGAPAAIKKALIEGGSWWNQAFEAAGYTNAFQVKELPEGADPMDIRYNVVNWINRSGSPRAFSYGASYVDPRTGEILKGVVSLGADRHRQDYLIAEGLLQPYEDGKPVTDQMEQLALARIRQLSAHEIGHTLGLYHNFTASTKERASVMDYPFPRFSLHPDGRIDVSDAYATGIGSWDKRAILWGYSEFAKGTDENTALDNIMKETLQQGFRFIPDIGGYVHPAANQWDEGADPVAQLTKLMAVRRHVLDGFSEKAIRANAPMATLEEVLVPIYLLQRYQIEAVAKSIGGQYFTHALKNDGQAPTKMVEPAAQQQALDALLATITPAALQLPEALIAKIPPRPSGYPGSLETFSGFTGPTFDPLAAAEAAAGPTIASILNPERAARLIEYQARDSKQPGFGPVVEQLLAHTWRARPETGYAGALQTVVNNLTLKYLLQLAADNRAAASVRGQALLEVDGLQKWMQTQAKRAQPTQKANLLFGLSQIDRFKADPSKFTTPPAVNMPPGAPIGMPNMDFMD
ncbi:zinc-dependent metalloprotease [Hymenobacter sp. BT770]|uniref:zinc-dependent metalloprotease n=1 Tax=Hymenobacter sp. BT770 TaxID=2886942 RepID=UPI001D124FE9|nr:zinc-dependent metalloprotease [Hymenobacter sp. BT770]MCC3153135.1 zinc-dependent metalloprotease [Hymenobacter sp. BT770]MDO3415391.1 zinc-dependent metalloprotease [Hymenobacter sp. BT770]